MKFFDPNDDLLITQRGLPHWAQDGRVVFITWRMNDSLPTETLADWRTRRTSWLTLRNIDPQVPGWKRRIHELPPADIAEFHETFTSAWHQLLDEGHGSCALRSPECANIVHDSLLHFNGDRYQMHSFVIMPNHLHMLVTFPDRDTMLSQCESWNASPPPTSTAVSAPQVASGSQTPSITSSATKPNTIDSSATSPKTPSKPT
jgi:hypothetical protein